MFSTWKDVSNLERLMKQFLKQFRVKWYVFGCVPPKSPQKIGDRCGKLVGFSFRLSLKNGSFRPVYNMSVWIGYYWSDKNGTKFPCLEFGISMLYLEKRSAGSSSLVATFKVTTCVFPPSFHLEEFLHSTFDLQATYLDGATGRWKSDLVFFHWKTRGFLDAGGQEDHRSRSIVEQYRFLK